MAGWQPPSHWTEIQGQLKKSGQVTLDSTGQGTLYFTPDNARQRWVVSSVVVSTNQDANATVAPYATVAINSDAIDTMSAGNNFGGSASGNQDTFSGSMDVGPVDTLAILFYPPPGQSGSSLSGVVASAVITGVRFTRRA